MTIQRENNVNLLNAPAQFNLNATNHTTYFQIKNNAKQSNERMNTNTKRGCTMYSSMLSQQVESHCRAFLQCCCLFVCYFRDCGSLAIPTRVFVIILEAIRFP